MKIKNKRMVFCSGNDGVREGTEILEQVLILAGGHSALQLVGVELRFDTDEDGEVDVAAPLLVDAVDFGWRFLEDEETGEALRQLFCLECFSHKFGSFVEVANFWAEGSKKTQSFIKDEELDKIKKEVMERQECLHYLF